MNSLRKIRDFVGCARALGPDNKAKFAILWRQTRNLRVSLGLQSHRPSEIYTLRTTLGTLHFRDNFGDITNLTDMVFGEAYLLPETPGDGVIIDVGANIGMAAVWFGSQYPGRPIHCFEPLAGNARMIALNAPSAEINRVAVGATPGTATLAVDADEVMASTIPYQHATGMLTVNVTSLDDYVARVGIERVAILKIDTEGMELDVIAGAKTTLSRTDSIAIETHGPERHRETIRALAEAGCRLQREEFDGSTGLVFAAGPASSPSSLT